MPWDTSSDYLVHRLYFPILCTTSYISSHFSCVTNNSQSTSDPDHNTLASFDLMLQWYLFYKEFHGFDIFLSTVFYHSMSSCSTVALIKSSSCVYVMTLSDPLDLRETSIPEQLLLMPFPVSIWQDFQVGIISSAIILCSCSSGSVCGFIDNTNHMTDMFPPPRIPRSSPSCLQEKFRVLILCLHLMYIWWHLHCPQCGSHLTLSK